MLQLIKPEIIIVISFKPWHNFSLARPSPEQSARQCEIWEPNQSISGLINVCCSCSASTINMLMWGEGVNWAAGPCGTCYLQWSNLFKSQRWYWGGGREYDKLWDILIFVTQSTSILTFKLESSCIMCHKTFTILPTFCRRPTGEQSFWNIFLVN